MQESEFSSESPKETSSCHGWCFKHPRGEFNSKSLSESGGVTTNYNSGKYLGKKCISQNKEVRYSIP